MNVFHTTLQFVLLPTLAEPLPLARYFSLPLLANALCSQVFVALGVLGTHQAFGHPSFSIASVTLLEQLDSRNLSLPYAFDKC
jgi:hypothetical protein